MVKHYVRDDRYPRPVDSTIADPMAMIMASLMDGPTNASMAAFMDGPTNEGVIGASSDTNP